MPNFYSVGSVMLQPRDIANRRAAEKGEAMVFKTKTDLVVHIVELSARKGKNISEAQKKRYNVMRRDQLEVLISNLSKTKDAKFSITSEKK